MLRGLWRAKPANDVRRAETTSRFVCTIEQMEPRLLMAAALARGGSGYSGTLSTNPSIRQMQLACDPDEPLEGSTSVTYNASKVSLIGYEFGPGYGQEIIIGSEGGGGIAAGSGEGYVGVRQIVIFPNGTVFRRTILQEINSFLTDPAGTEVGYVQFRYSRNRFDTGQIQPLDGYTIVDEGGVDGVDTHALYFRYRDGVPTTADATFTVFAAPANFVGGNPADYLVANDAAHTRIDAPNLTSATVSTLGLTTYVNGSTWASVFRSYLSRTLQGSSTLGYRVDDASKGVDSDLLPWVNLDTISFEFSQALPPGAAFDAAHVSVIGPDGQPRGVKFFSYDPVALKADIRLTGNLPVGRSQVTLDLDTLAGVDRTIYLNVSPGDVNLSGGGVNATDLVLTRNRVGQTVPPILIRKPYSSAVDVDGSGAINATDLVLVRNRIGVSAPALSAVVAPTFSDRVIDRNAERLDELQ